MTALPCEAQPTPGLPFVPGKKGLDSSESVAVFFQLVN
jgi:hypothetical protein